MTSPDSHNAAGSPPRKSLLHRTLTAVLFWSVVFAGGATLLALCAARLHWRLDLLTSFHHFYAIAMGGVLVALALQRPRSRALIIAAALTLLINAAIVAPLYWCGEAAAPDAPVLRVVFLNVLRSNQNDERVTGWLRRADPDVIIVNELTPHHDALIRREFPDYTHGAALPDEGYFGIGLFSRVPLEEVRVENHGNPHLDIAFANVKIGDATLMLASAHLSPPFRPEFAAARNQQSVDLAEFLAGQPRPLLFAGDLNMASWSPYFRDLKRTAKLRDGRRGFGLRATWPAPLSALGITIDHALCSEGVAIKSYAVGPNIGSDHRPFVVEVVLKEMP